MKNTATVRFLILFVCTAFLCSCKKNDSKAPPPAPKNYLAYADETSWAGAANPANQYDDAGLSHNQALQYILDSLEVDSLQIDKVYYASVGFAYTMGVGTQYTSDVTLTGFTSLYTGNGFDALSPDANLNALIDGCGFSTNVTNELKVLYDFSDTTNPYNYDTMKAKIMAWETNIMTSGYTPQEKELLLKNASVFRYSLYGWQNCIYPLTPSGHIMYKTTFLNISWKAVKRVLAVVGADAVASSLATLVTAGLGTAAAGAGVSALVSTYMQP